MVPDAVRTALFVWTLILCVPGVSAIGESTGVIIASVVAGVLLLLLVLGIIIFCFYRKGPFDENKNLKQPRKKKHKVFVANGYHAPPPHRYEKRQISNGYVPQPVPMVTPVPQPPPPAYIETRRIPPGPVPYATYHGPPPEIRQDKTSNHKAGTLSGPPTIFIPYNGTMTIRADPRPVVHKSSTREARTGSEERRRSESRHRSQSRHRSPTRQPTHGQPQEFVVQQSYDGVPVIRPVIYVDDDDNRDRHRSKSREHRYKKKTPSPGGAKIIEITDDNKKDHTTPEPADVVIEHRTRSRSNTPPRSPVLLRPKSPEPPKDERSRASSVTEAVNALRMSVRDHLDDSVSTTSHDSSNAPSFAWTKSHHHHHSERAPDPAAGDVMFFPSGTVQETTIHRPEPAEPKPERKNEESIYSYTKVIKETKKRAPSPPPTRVSPVPEPGPSIHVNHGYEVPSSLRRTTAGTREESKVYETEHGRTSGNYNRLGASMSDRLQNLVEDGDQTRYTSYNLGAMDFGTEDEKEEEEPVQYRVKRPDTPPLDIPQESHYAQVIKRRPATPPNDIPLISPRESTEVPPLNLRSTVNSPRVESYRPSTPPKDFPLTPQASFNRPRPATPPTDFPMTPRSSAVSPRPPTPPYDALETARSTGAASTTAEVNSFQARRQLIEAHLLKNISPSGPQKSAPAPKPSVPKSQPAPEPPRAPVPTVHITPGVVPPAPPPPPPPPPPPVKK